MKKFLVMMCFFAVSLTASDFLYDPNLISIESSTTSNEFVIKFNGATIFITDRLGAPRMENIKQQALSCKAFIKGKISSSSFLSEKDIGKVFYIPRIKYRLASIQPQDITISSSGVIGNEFFVILLDCSEKLKISKELYTHLTTIKSLAIRLGSTLDIDYCFLANPPSMFDLADIQNSFKIHEDAADSSSQSGEVKNREQIVCAICRAEAPTTACFPCGHLCTCEKCTPFQSERLECPLCRQKIESLRKIYY